MAVTAQQMPPLQKARVRRTQSRNYLHLGRAGVLVGTFFVVCVLSVLYLAQTGRVATRGYQLVALQSDEKALLRTSEQYQYRIAEANRLDLIEQRAIKLGMRPASLTQIRYLNIELDPAQDAGRH